MSKERVKKPFYKKWWFWAILVVVILGPIFSSMEEDEKEAKDEKEKVQQEDNKETKNDIKDTENEEDKSQDGEESEPKADLTIDKALVEDNDYISEAKLTDGKLTLIAEGKTTFSENTLFHSVYDLFEAMHDGFQDESVSEVYIELMTTMIDSKGNESIEPVIKYNYDREAFEELNYENFTNMAYSEEWRILREANYYYIHPGIYKNLKDKYKENLSVEGFKE